MKQIQSIEGENMINAIDEMRNLLRNMDMGHMGGVTYDTAWVARVKSSDGKAVFPQAVEWLINTQKTDGSWGCEIVYYHDRILSTLAALLALTGICDGRQRYKTLIERGERYIWDNIDKLCEDKHETIGFELLFPTLMADAEKAGLNLPFYKNHYGPLRDKKLNLIPKEYIYSKKTTVAHSIEFMGEEVDSAKLPAVQSENGSVLNSPSATAFFMSNVNEPVLESKAKRYIETVLNLNGGTAMTIFPFELYEIPFVLNNFVYSEMPVQAFFGKHIDILRAYWNGAGISLSTTFPITDLDDTAVAFKLLRLAGYNVDPMVFEKYEKEDHFLCYPFERNPSVAVNVHTLDALKYCKDYCRQEIMVEKILSFLKREMKCGAYWTDKYFPSPYYITSHAILALSGIDKQLADKAVDWILANQNMDGSWGDYGGSPEETAFALQALIHYHTYEEPLDIKHLLMAGQYLESNLPHPPTPELWIGKCLYLPTNITRSVIIAAYYAYRTRIVQSSGIQNAAIPNQVEVVT